MIAKDRDTTEEIAAQVEAWANPQLPEALKQLLDTLRDPGFPGALIPYIDGCGVVRVVAAALPSDWRRLSPVLRAFAGPTLTSFDGLPSAQPPLASLATLLEPAGPHVSATIELPVEEATRKAAVRAMLRARDTFARAPALTRTAPEPTSWMLARFQDHLNLGRRDAAAAILARLRDELRLDALNLKALEVQLLATFDDWAGIVALPGFANLVMARRTPATTALLLEALFRTMLAEPFEAGDQAAVERIYRDEVRSRALPMLNPPVPPMLRTGGRRILGLEALVSPDRTDLRVSALSYASELGWVAEVIAPTSEPAATVAAPLEEARERVIASAEVESADAMAQALAALSSLTKDQREELARAEPFRSVVRALEDEAGSSQPPMSWVAWLVRVTDPGFVDALDWARRGAEEWPIAAVDPTSVRELLDALDAAQGDEIATQRTAQALPYLIAALKRDPAYPNVPLVPIYSNLLTVLALGAARGASVYDSSIMLVEAILTAGIDVPGYRNVVADLEEIAGEGFGVAMVFWALEAIESLMRAGAPDASARDHLVQGFLAKLTPLRSRLSGLQRQAVRSLAQEFGWHLDDFALEVAGGTPDEFTTRLANKRIGIYSLVEAASRQAKSVLESAALNVTVECNAEHGGSSRLRTFAINSDLVVIVWGAAKHAATDFIREHRGQRPLVYAEGKGVSSLLRAVEDHYTST